ncbi:hypothetical protein EG329_000236 [Mollisiaceae sp. DMI_Dod_QoI]|nr:hypothetical protein EG329_000236 [Helotiales sp. DMI_Dod_QoI]
MLASSLQNGFHAASTAIRNWLLTGAETIINHPILVVAVLLFCASFAQIVYLKYFHPLARFRGPFLAPISNACLTLPPTLKSQTDITKGVLVLHDPQRTRAMAKSPLASEMGSHSAQKVIYGFGTRTVPSMIKDPIFFTPEVDHSMNIINETDREEHSRMRRMLSFAFSNSNLLENEDVLVRRTDDFVKTLGTLGREGVGADSKGKRGFNIVQQFNYVTFNIMGEMSFGDSFDKRLEEQPEYRYHWADVIVNTTYMNDVMRAVCVIPGLFSFLEWYKTDHMKKTLYRHAEYATEHTEARLKINTERKDFVHHILTSKGPRPTNLEMGSHFNVIMMAGAVTTATFLAGVTYYLGHNKAALSRLQHEVRSRFANLSEINSKALMDCEYLHAVVEEGLRIYPPAGAGHLSRIVPKGGCEIEGEWIPEGTRVSVHQWSVLRDPLNFWNPSAFIPERWMKNEPEGQGGDRLETSLPFSYGPRGCLGRNLAYLEMRMVLAKMFWQYDLVWFNSDEIDWERDTKGYTLWEKPDLRVLLRDRTLDSMPSNLS